MTRTRLSLMCALVVGCFCVPAFARPPYKNDFLEEYAKPDSPLGKTIETVVDNSPLDDDRKHIHANRCFLCHKGESRKNRNEFGQALGKYVTKTDYDNLKGTPEKLKEKVSSSLKKVLSDKNAKGQSFGELIKAGTLPGGPADP